MDLETLEFVDMAFSRYASGEFIYTGVDEDGNQVTARFRPNEPLKVSLSATERFGSVGWHHVRITDPEGRILFDAAP